MYINVHQTKLNKVLGVVTKALGTEEHAGVKIDATDGNVLVSASNFHMKITSGVDAEIIESGKIVVEGRKLAHVISKMDGTIKLKTDAGFCLIQSGTTRLKLPLMSEALDIELGPVNTTWTIGQDELKRALKRTMYATAQHDTSTTTRAFLQGLRIETADGRVRIIATDGNRLTMQYLNKAGKVGDEFAVLLPVVTATLIRSLCDDGDVYFRISKSTLEVTIGDYTIVSLLYDGPYPDCNAFIPKHTRGIEIWRDELLNTVDLMSIWDRKNKGTVIKMTAENDVLELNAWAGLGGDDGKAEDQLEIDYNGEPITTYYQAPFVKQAVANIDSEMILWSVETDGAGYFRAIEDGNIDLDYFSLLMPVRV